LKLSHGLNRTTRSSRVVVVPHLFFHFLFLSSEFWIAVFFDVCVCACVVCMCGGDVEVICGLPVVFDLYSFIGLFLEEFILFLFSLCRVKSNGLMVWAQTNRVSQR
jgi:hypothetical protein